VDLSGTSHINYLEVKTLKPAEQKGSYTPNTTRKSAVAAAVMGRFPNLGK